MPQFVNPALAAALCVRFPHVPISQVAERQGSGKITLNKSGSSGTRIWQLPWFLYPAFCDWLLGRVAPKQERPQINRPDVFSPCYPWLYCQEASVEGEDLLGVDRSLRAFYRRAIVTAKYQPLELNNSIHINSQMLTIPNTQFIFIGQSPTNLAGFQQVFGVEMVGRANGGTFQLGFANDAGAATFLVPPIGGAGAGAGPVAPPTPGANVTKTTPIKFNASAAEVRDAVRKSVLAADAAPTFKPDAVVVTGPEGKVGATGPWIITLNIPEVKTICSFPEDLTAPAAGLYLNDAKVSIAFRLKEYLVAAYGPKPTTSGADWWLATANNPAYGSLMYLYWSGKYTGGSFRFKITFEDGTINHSNAVDVATCKPPHLMDALLSALVSRTRAAPEADQNKDMSTLEDGSPGHAQDFGGVYTDNSVFMELPYLDGADILPDDPDAPFDKRYTSTMSQLATNDPYRPVVMAFSFQNLKSRVATLELVWGGKAGSGEGLLQKPTLKVTKYDPYLANRLDQNVGKVVPMGEITIQRHQVIATDMVYLLAVVGSVNMFTFQGFPPWTLLLSGIEAKQTRLPNGTPCFDMTFKFAFNPYTHQAIFRPLYMRWEFVRGVLIARVPNSVAVPKNPLSDLNGRAKVNPKAVAKAWITPKRPDVIPVAIDPRTGKPVAGGAGGIAGGAPGAAPGGGGPPVIAGEPNPPGGGGGAVAASSNPDLASSDPGQMAFSPDMPLGDAGPAGGGGNQNPNPPAQGGGANTDYPGGVQVPFGQVAANTVQNQTLNVVTRLSNPFPADPNSGNYNPADDWQSSSDTLGSMIAQSIGIGKGTADDEQKAAASGIEADIEQGRIDGADFVSTYDNGVSVSSTSGGTGNMMYDLALARNAHECGATLAPCTREFLGLPPEDATAGAGALGDAGSDLVDIAINAAVAGATANPSNVGASKSVAEMSTRVFDLGLIYPICDFTPILWMQ